MLSASPRARRALAAFVGLTLGGLALLTPRGIHAQRGVGAPYGARDPSPCAKPTAPTRGAPSAAQAAQYVACAREGRKAEQLYLVSDVRVQVGSGTPFSKLDPVHRPPFADPSGIIYPIRGSYRMYQCHVPDSSDAGQNCTRYDEDQATGTCFRNTFSEWSCNMTDYSARRTSRQPPPR